MTTYETLSVVIACIAAFIAIYAASVSRAAKDDAQRASADALAATRRANEIAESNLRLGEQNQKVLAWSAS